MAQEVDKLYVTIEGNIAKLLDDVAKGVNLSEKQLSKLEASHKRMEREAIKATRAQIAEHKKVVDLTRKLDRDLGLIPNRLKQIGDTGQRAFALLKAGIAGAAATAVASTVGRLTDAATEAAKSQFELSNSLAAANREFGTGVGTQESWIKNLKAMSGQLKTFGQKDVNEATARLVDMTKRLGLTEEEMQNVLSRTADLSAGKVDLAGGIERVTAALRGEAESAEFLGLSLSETQVRAYAESQGLVFKELTDNEKAHLRYKLLLDQTNALQGRAAEFAKTRAGQEAVLNAQLQTQAAVLGEQLMPLRDGYNQLLASLTTETETSSSIITQALAAIAASLIALGVAAKLTIDRTVEGFKLLGDIANETWDAIKEGRPVQDVWAAQAERLQAIQAKGAVDFREVWLDAFQQVQEGWRAQREATATVPGVSDTGGTQTPPGLPGLGPEETERAKKLLLDSHSELLDLQEKLNQESEQAAADHGEAMLEIEAEFAEKRAEEAKQLTKELAELEKETAEDRARIISDAKEELADLERETDQAIEAERDKFNTDERRETEDHLREMRRLRNQYLFDLEDAVKSRDARAIVDLRRRYELERSERSQDFEIKSGREREDKNKRLAQIRQEEQERAAEIIRNREAELQQLMAQEAEKRAELQASYTEQIAQLNQAEAEKLAKEQEAYAERQAQLDSAMSERLKLIAEKLAEEKDITGEGAEAILKTLAKTFGEGGEIDELMEAYRNRLQTKMQIKIEFEGGDLPSVNGSGGDSSGGQGGNFNVPMKSFAKGGSILATKPTVALFGEAGPEMANFIPLRQQEQAMSEERTINLNLKLELSGSAPPGINSADRDAIAQTLVSAFREAGIAARPGSR